MKLKEDRFISLLPFGQKFLDETRLFFYNKADEIEKYEKLYPLQYYDLLHSDDNNSELNETISVLRQRICSYNRTKKLNWIENVKLNDRSKEV